MLILLQSIDNGNINDFFIDISEKTPFLIFKQNNTYGFYLINNFFRSSTTIHKNTYYNKTVYFTEKSFKELHSFIEKNKFSILNIDLYSNKNVLSNFYYHNFQGVAWEANIVENVLSIFYEGVQFKLSREKHSVKELYDKISTFQKMSTNLKNMN